MSRTRAEALALVNWKGVFYERYLLDRHVTALEGANGAGKTTVMIAAYVVLLPDMSRLRFTNLGETGATGGDKGIWGRLGESGPAYAALDFRIAGKQRLIAGVHLERKGEPSVEPTPFIVFGLGDDVRLQDLLLVRRADQDFVPALSDLRENAARLGGRFQHYLSAREYFVALFDQGVTPLRLGTDQERNKLNEMLRTSMTGGISRALTSELRAFLLKEEGGLADTLQRMRSNLDACRRTRTEVQEARRLEREIGDVFAAGQTMFAAAFLATRERAEDLERRVAQAEEALRSARMDHATAEEALIKTREELEALQARRDELTSALESARAWHDRVCGALAAARELARRADVLEGARAEAARAEEARRESEVLRGQKREALRRSQDNYNRAAAGLADLQEGIAELHRRAGAYQQAVRRLREAEAMLSVPLAPAEFERQLSTASSELARVDEARREKKIRLDDADAHRRRHELAMTALRALLRAEVSPEQAHSSAEAALRDHRALETVGARLPEINSELPEARMLAARQESARQQAERLGLVLSGGPAARRVEELLDMLEAEQAEHLEQERQVREEIALAEQAQRQLEQDRRELSEREPEWREHQERAGRLAAYLGIPVKDRVQLDAARHALAEELEQVRAAEELAKNVQEQLTKEARELLSAGGPFAPELLRLRDELDAELVAGGFEDVSVEDAAVLEARLGALTQALAVDDPKVAAHTIEGRSEVLSDVLLVSRDASLDGLSTAPRLAKGARDVIVEEGLALRVSRIPARPRLGRRARELRAKELQEEAERMGHELDGLRYRRRELERLVIDGDSLLAGHVNWLAGDPRPELHKLKQKFLELEAQVSRLHNAVARHSEAASLLRPRVVATRALLAEAFLLDPPDRSERVASLEAEQRAALDAQAQVAANAPHARLVERELATLRTVPLSEEDVDRLRSEIEVLRERRQRLDAGIEALAYVRDNAEALGWSEAPGRLASSEALIPALKAQLKEAELARDQAQEAASTADKHHDTVSARATAANGHLTAAVRDHADAQTHFESFGVPAATEEAVSVAAAEEARISEELSNLSERRDALLKAEGGQETACTEALQRVQRASDEVDGVQREARPAIERWERLQESAAKHRLLGGLAAQDQAELGGVRGHVNLVQAALTKRELLLERLRSAQGGAELLTELEILRAPAEGDFGGAILDLWLAVRNWLRRRLPAQVTEVDDPREALLRLRDQLAGLEDRLQRQENDLRGASEDMARAIEVQVRKARGQVTRLNKNLSGVSFGSIQAIRVQVLPVERMEQVLRALKQGEAQGLLFQQDMPIEDALDEIFKRYGGGGRTGGQRLLDYREYLQLQVEIKRKAGKDWEHANPTRLSTGEAIGVGAALMMVVLTEWERDASLLRGKKAHGSLRFLFLDEANRLSQDNLGVLFDLCQNLDLQLLIAAPEVARAEGNTTYRLVRYATADGREEVLVSGRRTRAEA